MDQSCRLVYPVPDELSNAWRSNGRRALVSAAHAGSRRDPAFAVPTLGNDFRMPLIGLDNKAGEQQALRVFPGTLVEHSWLDVAHPFGGEARSQIAAVVLQVASAAGQVISLPSVPFERQS